MPFKIDEVMTDIKHQILREQAAIKEGFIRDRIEVNPGMGGMTLRCPEMFCATQLILKVAHYDMTHLLHVT